MTTSSGAQRLIIVEPLLSANRGRAPGKRDGLVTAGRGGVKIPLGGTIFSCIHAAGAAEYALSRPYPGPGAACGLLSASMTGNAINCCGGGSWIRCSIVNGRARRPLIA